MIQLVEFFRNSYKLDPFAFYCEMLESILLIGASAILTFTVLDPATKVFIPMYFAGSILGIISALRRKAAFVLVLCAWFTMMNAIALLKLFIL